MASERKGLSLGKNVFSAIRGTTNVRHQEAASYNTCFLWGGLESGNFNGEGKTVAGRPA